MSLRRILWDVVLISLMFFLGFLARFIFVPLMPTLEREWKISHEGAGTFFLFMAFGFISGQILSGLFSSRWNHRGNLIISAFLVGLSLFLVTLAPSLSILRIFLILLGFSAGLHLPSAVATIAASVDHEDLGKAMGVHQTAPILGMIIGPFLVEASFNVMSWRLLLCVISTSSVLLGLLFCLLGRTGSFAGKPPTVGHVKAVTGYPGFWVMVVIIGAGIGAAVGVYSMLPLFLIHEKGLNLSKANVLVGMSRIPCLFLTFLGGWLSDRLGMKITMAGSIIASGLALVGLVWSKGFLMNLFVFLQPALVSLFFAPAFAALSRCVPSTQRSIATSLAPPLAFVIGGGVIPYLLGYLGEHWSFSAGMGVIGIYSIGVAFLLMFLQFHPVEEGEGC